jgi:hypothetical protein
VHTLPQLVDYLNTHGAPAQLVDQVRNLQLRHALTPQAFQDLCSRLGWRPHGVSVSDAVAWVRQGVRG